MARVRVAVVNSRVFVCTLALLLRFCVAIHEVISEHARVRRSLHLALILYITCGRQGFRPVAMAPLKRPAPAIKRIWPRLGEVHVEACHMTVGEICILDESLILYAHACHGAPVVTRIPRYLAIPTCAYNPRKVLTPCPRRVAYVRQWLHDAA